VVVVDERVAGRSMLKFWRGRSGSAEPRAAAPDGADRRRADRLDKVFPVWLEGENGCGMGVARNISEGGMFVETGTPHPIGSQVRITFPSHSGEMTAVAEVRYVCHLVGRPADDSEIHASVQGLGVRFLYFEARGTVSATLQ
jgi:hypothetical protein